MADPTSDGPDRPENKADPKHVADYVADMTGELSKLARSADLDVLAYLLDIAKLEAAMVSDNKGRRRRG